MGTIDRALRAFVVAPVAIVVALIVGGGTLGGVIPARGTRPSRRCAASTSCSTPRSAAR